MLPPRVSLLCLLAPLLAGGGADPGLLLEVDLDAFRLQARDLGADAAGPSLRVSVGSPTHPTPTGEFRPVRIVRNPAWTPGPYARSLGAQPHPPSKASALGAGKLPLGHGAIQIHAGAHPLELGKAASLGCVRVDDAGWGALLAWLEESQSLQPWRRTAQGEIETGFRRPLRVVVRQSR